jgi:uncharacterized protein
MEGNTIKYKTSKYNYFIDYKGRKLLFNGLTGAGFHMSEQEYKQLISYLENTNGFAQNYPNDFKQLLKLGYVIESDFDEIAYMKFKNRQMIFQDKSYRLTINPTLDCNFKCWYCYQDHPKDYMTKLTISKIKRHIKYMIEQERITSLLLDWFGGEPLLYFYEVMYPIAIYAKNLCKKHNIPYSSQMTTNAYCINEKMISYLRKIQNSFFQITLDGDREKHNKVRNASGKPSYDVIMDNINLLCKKMDNIYITLRLNYDEKTLQSETIYSILDDIKEDNRKKIRINMQRVWQTKKGKLDKEQQQHLIDFMQAAKEKGFKISSGGGLSIGVFYTCYVSRYYHTEINYDGKVYKCTARTYTDEYILGELMPNGIINWNEKKLSKMYANPTFENALCLACKYLPICNGVCPQNILDANGNMFTSMCILDTLEYSFEEQIIDYYEMNIKNKQEENQDSKK